jgi:hypothetical protein
MKNTYLNKDFNIKISQDKVKAEAGLEGVDILMVRPIRHRIEDRIRAHNFLFVWAYCVQWHMIQARKLMIYANEQLAPVSEIGEAP